VDSGTTNILFAAQADLDAVVQAISSSGIISFASGVSQANKDSFWQGNVT